METSCRAKTVDFCSTSSSSPTSFAPEKDLVVPLPQSSEHAAIILSRLGIRAGLIHIDAAHEYDPVMRDVRTYWELLEPGGYLVGDDYVDVWPDVIRVCK
jgi:hypothetical protein